MKTRTLAGVFFLTFSALVFEINLASQFVMSAGHHFASVVVSTALLGIGCAGVSAHLFPRPAERLSLSFVALILGAIYPASMALAGMVPFDPVQLDWDAGEILHLFLYFPLFGIPFFFSALVVVRVVKRWHRFAGKIYFADMTGAAMGGAAFLVAVRAASLPVALCVASAICAALLLRRENEKTVWGVVPVALCAVLLYPYYDLPVSEYKEISHYRNYPHTRTVERIRAPEGRVELIASPYLRYAPGLNPVSGTPVPSGTGLFLNGALYAVLQPPERDFLMNLPASLAYRLKPWRNALVIGGNGITEMRIARHVGIGDVTLLENKRSLAGLLAEHSGDSVETGDYRRYLAGSGKKYDLISIPVTASYRGAGAGTLNENYLLTKEFIALCKASLSPGGVLTATIPLLPPPRAEIRLLRLFAEADDGWHKSAAFRSWGTFTAIYKNEGFDEGDMKRLNDLAVQLLLDTVYYPGIGRGDANRRNRFDTPVYYDAVMNAKNGGDTLFDTTPPGDDAPFFANVLKFGKLRLAYRAFDGRWLPLLTGGGMDILVVAIALTVSLPLLLVTLLFSGRTVGGNGVWLCYFFSLGCGYMLAEVVFIQKGILLLGSPVASTAMVIPTLLCSSAVGGLVSGRLRFGSLPPLCAAGALIAAAALFGPLSDPFSPLPAKSILFFLMVVCVGLPMGIPYPLGLRRAGEGASSLVPLAMASNGFASVIGAAVAPLAALLVGFRLTLATASTLYLIAGLTAYLVSRRG